MRRVTPAVLALALVVTSCGTPGSANDVAFGDVAVSGALPEYVGEPDAASGMPLPSISGTGLSGEAVAIEADGRAKIVVALAHWCPHCEAEVPRIVDWIDAGGLPDGVDVIALATGTTAELRNFPPGAWLVDEDWTAPVVFDDEAYSAGEALGLSGFPFFVFSDADGNVVQRTSGELDPAMLAMIADSIAP